MRNNIQNYAIYILSVLLVVSIYLMNSYVPFFSDDLHCIYYGTKRIENFSDVLNVLRFDYVSCNGRIIPNLLVMLAVWAGEGAFNIINTLLTSAAFLLLWKTVAVNNKYNRLLSFLILTIGFLLLSTGIDSLYYWAAGASNYVWTLISVLLFIRLMDKDYKCNIILLFILAFILGLQHEMYVCPIAAAFWVIAVFNRKWMTNRRWSLLAGFTVAMAILVMAPGNFGRGSTYTIGLGAMSRIVKIMYSLRIFYVFVIAAFISYLKDRNLTISFFKDNSTYILIIGFSFVIPFLAATASRAVYAIDIFSLIVLIKLINTIHTFHKIVDNSLTICFTVFLIWFQGSIVQSSSAKWKTYKQAVKTYESQTSNTVVMNDIQCSNPLIEYYTVNMNNILMPRDKSVQLALKKRRSHGQRVSEDDIKDDELIKVIPENIDTTSGKKIPNVGFINHTQMRYFIMPWKPNVVEKINYGRFYVMYKVPIINIKLKINYLSNDVDFERAAYSITYKGKRYILLNKKYKHYPFIKMLYMGFNNEEAASKLELLQ